jgi:hypothetical protein
MSNKTKTLNTLASTVLTAAQAGERMTPDIQAAAHEAINAGASVDEIKEAHARGLATASVFGKKSAPRKPPAVPKAPKRATAKRRR